MTDVPYGSGSRMLTLGQVCAWFNITERHVRKLVERDAVPYRKVGHLLRFPEAELEVWSRPSPKARPVDIRAKTIPRQRGDMGARGRNMLPRSLID